MRPSLTFWFWLAIVGIVAAYVFLVRPIISHEKVLIDYDRFDKLGGVKSALGQYQLDNGIYPKSLQDLLQKSNDATNWHGPYFDPPKLPIDPWGNNYFYEYPGKHNTNAYDLFSAGPDGRVGTKDDIGNWQK